MSGWSAFRLGMTRPELTVLGVGEFERPGGDDWGILIRDLRTGEERVVFEEAEWERIKKKGLPPVGSSWGEALIGRPPVSPQVDQMMEVERRLFEAGQATRPQAPPPPTSVGAKKWDHELDSAWEARSEVAPGRYVRAAMAICKCGDILSATAEHGYSVQVVHLEHITAKAGVAEAELYRVLYDNGQLQIPWEKKEDNDPSVQPSPSGPAEAANAVSQQTGGALTSEEYDDAVSEATEEFARRLKERLPLSDKQLSLAEREVAMLYLTAARAWFHRLESPDESRVYGGDEVVGEMAASCWFPDPDVWSADGPDQWLKELDAMLDARSAEYGDLALSRPLNASKELRRRFALRLRAEVNGSQEVEELAMHLFGDLPNLDAAAMVRRFVNDEGEDED